MDDLQDGRLGQDPGLAGAGVDPGDDLLGRIAGQAIAGGVPQPGREGDLAWGLPGAGGGDLGGAVGVVLDASAAGLNRAEDGLEGERRGAAAGDPLAVFAVAPGQDELGVGLFDGVLEQEAFEHLAPRSMPASRRLGRSASCSGRGSSRQT